MYLVKVVIVGAKVHVALNVHRGVGADVMARAEAVLAVKACQERERGPTGCIDDENISRQANTIKHHPRLGRQAPRAGFFGAPKDLRSTNKSD